MIGNKKGEGNLKVKENVKRVLYVLVSIVGVFLLILLLIPAFLQVLSGDSLAQQEKEISKLEKYYLAGNYEKMCEYLTDIDKTGGEYEKYVRLCKLYENMKVGIGSLEKIEDTEEIEVEYLQECLQMCMHDLSRIEEIEKLNYPYDEQQGTDYIRKQYEEAIKQYLLLTEDEITTAIMSYMGEDTDYMELAEIALQRIEERRY